MKRDYATLDAIVVVYSLTIVAGVVAGLFLVKLDPAVAPIVSSLATALLGLAIAYGAFRWGSSVSKDVQPVQVVNKTDDPVPVEGPTE